MKILKNRAFTLAEVLITLGIIGVVAAMTIPTLLAKYQEKQTVIKLKQTYSILSQAIRSVQEDVGTPDDWDLVSNWASNQKDAYLIAEYLLPSLKVVQDCGFSISPCISDKTYKYLNGVDAGKYGNGFYSVILMNGTSISWSGFNSNERIDFFIDINGPKKPNTWGKDLFAISWFRDKGLYPLGSPSIGIDKYNCDKSGAGWGCAYHVLHYENMSYLK